MRDLKILLLENEQPWQKIIQQDIQQVLNTIGHPNDSIEVVETLEQARQALENERQWNLLVADVFFPSSSEMKGIELVRQANQLGIAIIILSDRETLTNLQDELFKYRVQARFTKENYYTQIDDFILKVQQILKTESYYFLTQKELFGSELNEKFNLIWKNSISAIEQNRLDKFQYETDLLTRLLCKKLGFILLDDTADFEHWYGYMIDASNPAFQLNIRDKFPVVYLRRNDCYEEDILTAIGLLNQFKINAKYFAIIVVFCNKETIIKQIRQSAYRNDFIVFDRDQIWNILAAESPLKQLTDYILQQIDLIAVSPYTYAGPVKSQMFFGREQEKKTLIENISRNDYAILANRQTGKTSLLNRIFPTLNQDPCYQVFYCDLQAVRDYESFYKYLATSSSYPEFKAEIAKLDQPTALGFHEIINHIKQHNNNRQIIIIFDEVDELLSYDLNFKEQLFGVFRSLSQRENVHFIFSGTTTLVKRFRHPDSPLFNFCQTIKIDLLDEKSATDLIVVPMKKIGVKFEGIKSENGKEIKFENKKAIVESILSITARHPNLIQYLCDSLIKIINNKQERTITERDIDSVINSDEFYEYCETLIWGQSKPIDKLIVYLMWSYPQFTESDVIEEFKKRGLETDGVKDSLETLQIYTTLRQKNRTYSFTYRDFAILMRQRSDIEALVEIYQQEVGGSKS